MRFSLIVATLGRTIELEKFLHTLIQQTYKDFELIIVDQNENECLAPLLVMYKNAIKIMHLRCENKGNSHARNYGARFASGEILTFPDDDCWYSEDVLQMVYETLKNNPKWSGLTGKVIDEQGNSSIGRWYPIPVEINKYNEWIASAETSIFIYKNVFLEVGGFDHNLGLGPGIKAGSCEGDDLILRAIDKNYRFYYNPEIAVFHSQKEPQYTETEYKKVYRYGYGMGKVLKKSNLPLWFVLYYWLRPFGGMILASLKLNPKGMRRYFAMLRGRIDGWLAPTVN